MGQDLIAKLRLVLAELARPGAQKNDWFAWAAGQMAHAMIGAVLAGGLAFVVPPIWAFLAAALGYAAAKEVPDSGARQAGQARGIAFRTVFSWPQALLWRWPFVVGMSGFSSWRAWLR